MCRKPLGPVVSRLRRLPGAKSEVFTMKNEQIELLMSGLLDGELRSDQRSEAERLLASDNRGKAIYEDYNQLHRMFDAIRSSKVIAPALPTNFAETVLNIIDTRTAVAGSTETFSDYSDKADWKARLKNPRIWAFPILAILVALGITFLPAFNGGNQNDNNNSGNSGSDIAITIDPGVHDPVVASPGSDVKEPGTGIEVAPPPMPGVDQNTEILTPQQIIEKQRESLLKSGLNIPCVLKDNSRSLESRLLPYFAERGINWSKITHGTNAQTVFEVALTPEPLKELLQSLESDPNIKMSVPDLLEKTLPGVAHEQAIKVRFFIAQK